MTDDTLTFANAVMEDAEDVAALVESAYRGATGRQGWTLEAFLVGGRRTDASAVRALMASADTRIVLARRGTELVACCLLQQRAPGAYLGMLSVRPQLQRSGLGRALVAEAERRAASLWGAQRVDIQVLGQDERLVRWYQRQGYLPTGTTIPFAPTNGAVPERPLHFVAMGKRLTTNSAVR